MGVEIKRSWSPSVYLHTYSWVEDQSRGQWLISCSGSLQRSEWQLASLTQWEKVRPARSEHDWAGQALSAAISFTPWMQFLLLCSSEEYSAWKQKATVFITNEWTRWVAVKRFTSAMAGWDLLCLQKLVRADKRFQWGSCLKTTTWNKKHTHIFPHSWARTVV